MGQYNGMLQILFERWWIDCTNVLNPHSMSYYKNGKQKTWMKMANWKTKQRNIVSLAYSNSVMILTTRSLIWIICTTNRVTILLTLKYCLYQSITTKSQKRALNTRGKGHNIFIENIQWEKRDPSKHLSPWSNHPCQKSLK